MATVDEALSGGRGVTFSACVVDLMFGGDRVGLQLVPRLRRFRGWPPVVVIAASPDVAQVIQTLNAGATYLLERPFPMDELPRVLQRLRRDPGPLGHHVDAAIAGVNLTPREAAVTRLVLKGLKSVEIGRATGISEKTVRHVLGHVYNKFCVSTRAELFHHVFPS